MDSIAKLRELTAALPPFPMALENNGKWTEYPMEQGTSHAKDLHTEPGKVSAALWINSEESRFPRHAHPEREVLVVIAGEMHIETNGEKRVLRDGEMIINEPDVPHSAYFPKRTTYLAITCPDSKDWPK